MSKATKRKHVVQEVMNDYVLPSGEQEIVRVLASKGNNLHEVETPKDERYLVSMPSRFRKNIWIKRGDFVLVQPIEEGNKVRAEIVSILYKDQIKYIKQEGKWPAEFEEQKKEEKMDEDLLPPSDDSDTENYSDLIVNTNRPRVTYCESEDSSEDEDNETASETVSDSKR